MINIAKEIEDRLAENKKSIKTYVSHKSAEERGETLGKQWMQIQDTDVPIQFIPVFLPRLKRWTVVFNLTTHLRCSNTGGYIMWLGQQGFYTI